ncbi:MAG: prephenate dehydrogenase [Terriglobales bacterium]
MQRILILGTGLIGASVGLALRSAGFDGDIAGWDRNRAQAELALQRGAVNAIAEDGIAVARASDVVVLAMPVLAILDWMGRLAPVMRPGQLLTDVGSTKSRICQCAAELFPQGAAAFLPGHPMAGKETFGAAAADASLFQGAVWLFTPLPGQQSPAAAAWRAWVARFGSRGVDLDPERHDQLCAWASHLPQLVGTALAAALEDEFGASAAERSQLREVGGRAMREMTRLGASPFSMWRDIAHTNAAPIAASLLRLEQRLAHLRRSLVQPDLKAEFAKANRFRRDF